MKTFLKNHRAAGLLVLVAILGLMAALIVHAQPYLTNVVSGITNPPFAGAYTPNSGVVQPYLPSVVLARQANGGICSGVLPPGGPLTTNFPSTVTYTVAPVILVSGSLTNDAIAVSAVTTTNVTFLPLVTNSLTIYWMAVGH